ncbi:MAG: glycerate kinase, partial [Oscillospiraceae bacterium]|nr:glycerate kinase [Oscillospiraceae bacterium]
AAAMGIEGMRGAAVLALGSDGTDGPTDAAGGIVDGGTAARIKAAGRDPLDCLADNDSYGALRSAGALLVTGPTGTNVNDVAVVLVR